MLLTSGLSRGINGVTLPIVTLGTIRREDSGAARNATSFSIRFQSETKFPAVWACLGVDPLDMPRTPYRANEGKPGKDSSSSKSLLYVAEK